MLLIYADGGRGGRVSVGLGVRVGFLVGVEVNVGVVLAVGVLVCVGREVRVAVAVGSGVSLLVGVTDGDTSGVAVANWNGGQPGRDGSGFQPGFNAR